MIIVNSSLHLAFKPQKTSDVCASTLHTIYSFVQQQQKKKRNTRNPQKK